jgi:hypothetical protein
MQLNQAPINRRGATDAARPSRKSEILSPKSETNPNGRECANGITESRNVPWQAASNLDGGIAEGDQFQRPEYLQSSKRSFPNCFPFRLPDHNAKSVPIMPFRRVLGDFDVLGLQGFEVAAFSIKP